MKAEERWQYRALTYIPIPFWDGSTTCLCAFCRYAKWSGSCKETEMECTHPLIVRYDDDLTVWEGYGQDCWGFRPDVPIPVADGMVQAWLTGKNIRIPDWMQLGYRGSYREVNGEPQFRFNPTG